MSSATMRGRRPTRQAGHRSGQGGVSGLVALWPAGAPRGAEEGLGRDHGAQGRDRPLLSREEGKTLAEGIGETIRAAQIFDFFAGETLRLSGETVPSVRPGVGVEITREAVGVVGIITPWNFPIAIPAWKIAPALCHGNTVVFKPAELVPEQRLGHRRHPAPRRPAEGRAQPRHGQGLGGRPGDARQPRRQRHHLHRLGRHRQARRRRKRRAHAQVPARNGRQEPAGRARRCRPRRRRRLRASTAPSSRPASAARPRRG